MEGGTHKTVKIYPTQLKKKFQFEIILELQMKLQKKKKSLVIFWYIGWIVPGIPEDTKISGCSCPLFKTV